jgi:hypothetical protein
MRYKASGLATDRDTDTDCPTHQENGSFVFSITSVLLAPAKNKSSVDQVLDHFTP